MAKIKSIIEIEGSIGEVTYKRTKAGNIASRKSNLDKERIMTDPNFERTRENMGEFRNSAKGSKRLKDAIHVLLVGILFKKLYQRLLRLMVKSLRFDTVNVRGQRKPEVSLLTPQGKNMINGFDFSESAPLESIFFKPISIDGVTDGIMLGDVKPNKDLIYPTEAKYVRFSAGVVVIDLDTGVFDLQLTPEVMLEINSTVTNVTLTPDAVPVGTGLKLYVLKVEFLEMVNGVYYNFKNGKFNPLSVVSVG